jgi:hypothetical protein
MNFKQTYTVKIRKGTWASGSDKDTYYTIVAESLLEAIKDAARIMEVDVKYILSCDPTFPCLNFEVKSE